MTELFYEAAGSGRPVVLLHPGFADSRIWDPQWHRYAKSFRVVRCDLAGFGRSPITSMPVTYARDVAELLDADRVTHAGIVGCSLGARVALELAIARPDLVRALVLVGAAVPEAIAAAPEMASHAAALIDAFGRADLDAAVELNVRTWVDGPRRAPDQVDAGLRAKVATMQRDAFINTREFAASWTEEPLVTRLAVKLDQVCMPTLVTVGELDMNFIREQAHQFAAGITGARLETLAGTAHAPSLERPEEFNHIVLPFLDANQHHRRGLGQ